MFNINPSVESQHNYFIVCRNLNYPLLNYSQSIPIYLSFITVKKDTSNWNKLVYDIKFLTKHVFVSKFLKILTVVGIFASLFSYSKGILRNSYYMSIITTRTNIYHTHHRKSNE